jgi:hypothetical protein
MEVPGFTRESVLLKYLLILSIEDISIIQTWHLKRWMVAEGLGISDWNF